MSKISKARLASNIPKGLTGLRWDGKPQPPSDNELFRRAIFKKRATKLGSQVTGLDAFYNALTADAASGDVHAMKAVRRIDKHFQDKDECKPTLPPDHPIVLSKQKYESFRRIGNLLGGQQYLSLIKEVSEIFEKKVGKFKLRSSMVPPWLDLQPALDLNGRVRRKAARHAPKSDFKVGRGKPPVEGQFTSEKNPSKKKQKETPHENFKKFQYKNLTLKKSNGETKSSTRAARSYDQLLKHAVEGNPAARDEFIRRIFELDRNEMLSPPEPQRRSKRKPVDEALMRQLEAVMPLMRRKIKEDMIVLFSRSFDIKLDDVEPSANVIIDYEYAAKQEAEKQKRQGEGASPPEDSNP